MYPERRNRQPDDYNYPLFGESLEQFRRWHLAGYYGRSPNEDEIRQWRVNTFGNTIKLPLMRLTDATGLCFISPLDKRFPQSDKILPPQPSVIEFKRISPN